MPPALAQPSRTRIECWNYRNVCRNWRLAILLGCDPLSQPHAGAATVVVDEVDAGRFESPPNGMQS